MGPREWAILSYIVLQMAALPLALIVVHFPKGRR